MQKKYGFEINPYDPCVANKMIDSKRMTVLWHVDDLKVSHVDPWDITKLSMYLQGIYGSKLVVHRGKVHDYLGMDLDFSEKGSMQICIIKYLIRMLQAFPTLIDGVASTPEAEYLFKVRDDESVMLLTKEQAQIFHHTVAQLLFMSERAKWDV